MFCGIWLDVQARESNNYVSVCGTFQSLLVVLCQTASFCSFRAFGKMIQMIRWLSANCVQVLNTNGMNATNYTNMAAISPYIHEIRLNVCIRDCLRSYISKSASSRRKQPQPPAPVTLRTDFATFFRSIAFCGILWQFMEDLSKHNSHFLFYIGLF